jgi:putative transposase
VTFNVGQEAIARTSGTQSMAFDWGIKTLLTMVVGEAMTSKVEEVENLRWLKNQLSRIARLQQFISKTEDAAKKASGKQKSFPVCHLLKNAYARRRSIHRRIAAQRHDFHHQLTAALVKTYGLIITEELAVKNITASPKPKEDPDNPGQYLRNGAASKAGLNRSTLDAAPATLLALLDYKALEAGSKLQFIPTRVVKPTQRCHLCGLATKLTLKDRTWQCSCGVHHDRDINAPRTMMRYAYEGAWWKENSRKGIGQELAGNHKVARNHF